LNQAYKYTGKPFDSELDLDIYYYGARYYNPHLGRWLAVDPLHDKYPSLSPYVYCADNPMKYVDPDGMKTQIFPIPVLHKKHIFIRIKNDNLNINTTRGYYPLSRINAAFNLIRACPNVTGDIVILKTDLQQELGEVLKNESGENSEATLKATIEPPDGVSSDEFDQIVLDATENHRLGNYDYNVINGPNSNTVVDNVIESTGAKMPDIPDAQAQNYGVEEDEDNR